MSALAQTITCPSGGALWSDGRCVPEGIVGAPATWVLDLAIPAFAAVMVAVMVRDAIRKGHLTWWLLLSISSASCWWLESFGDWGQHLSYSPEFAHYTLDWPLTAPHNPYWMPLMYAVYWVAHAWAILRLAQWLQRRRPGLSLGRGILLLSVPVTWVWNLCIEGFAASVGWWTYQPPVGPFLDMGRGNWPLLWPMLLMFGWINLIAWMVGPPEDEHRPNRIEQLFRIDRWGPSAPAAEPVVAPEARGGVALRTAAPLLVCDPTTGGTRIQLRRFGAWLVFFQASFAGCFVVPLVGLRMLTGWDTPYS
jgi:hypothetical protein